MRRLDGLRNLQYEIISNQVPKRKRFNDYPKGVGSSEPKWEAPCGEDIV